LSANPRLSFPPHKTQEFHMAGTVTVGCKLPHGLELRVFEMEERDEAVIGGGTRVVKVARSAGTSVQINGNAVPHGQAPRHQIVGGFAITSGVDADFWAKWLEQNKDSAIVKSGLIFAAAKAEDIKTEGCNRAKIKSGLEPLAQSGDARAPKGRGVTAPEAATTTAA
jgi:hypothetical protein